MKERIIVIIDDFDLISSSKDAINMICKVFEGNKNILLIAITSKISKIPNSLRRNGRFSREIHVVPPNQRERKLMLIQLFQNFKIDNKFHDLIVDYVVKETNGFLISDLIALIREIMIFQFKNNIEVLKLKDFESVLKSNSVKPSLLKDEINMLDIANDVSELKWDDIGGLEDVKLKLRQCIEWPVRFESKMKKLGILESRGVLLYGPPGCGKTSLVKALAHTIKFSFLYLSSASVFSPYVGESERTIREIFKKARLSSPSIIFFDEIDSVVGKRDFSDGGSGGIEQRILSTLLNEMDGIGIKKNVVVVAATNRPDMIDRALLRPGRLDYMLYVPPPNEKSRFEILKIFTRDLPLHKNIDFTRLVKETRNFSGADVESLCREATFLSIKRNIKNPTIEMDDFSQALKTVNSSINDSVIKKYEELNRKKF